MRDSDPQNFDRGFTIERRVHRFPDQPHRAFAQFLDEAIVEHHAVGIDHECHVRAIIPRYRDASVQTALGLRSAPRHHRP